MIIERAAMEKKVQYIEHFLGMAEDEKERREALRKGKRPKPVTEVVEETVEVYEDEPEPEPDVEAPPPAPASPPAQPQPPSPARPPGAGVTFASQEEVVPPPPPQQASSGALERARAAAVGAVSQSPAGIEGEGSAPAADGEASPDRV